MGQIVNSEWFVTGLISPQDKTLFIEIHIRCVVRYLALPSFSDLVHGYKVYSPVVDDEVG